MMYDALENKNHEYGISNVVYPILIVGKDKSRELAIFTPAQVKVAIKRGQKHQKLKQTLIDKFCVEKI